MPVPFDDRLPDREPLPTPGGWFEVFCCGSMVVTLVVLVVVVALVH